LYSEIISISEYKKLKENTCTFHNPDRVEVIQLNSEMMKELRI